MSGSRDTPRRQHYVSAMLLKQWGNRDDGRNTVVDRYDLYTRQTSQSTAGAECVFEDVLGTRDGGHAFLDEIRRSEDEWQRVENAAARKLDQIRTKMGASDRFNPDIKDILKHPKTLKLLRQLAVLHHGRNLQAIIECWRGASSNDFSAGERAKLLRASIDVRMADAEGRYRGGILFCTPQRGSEFVLGSVPVSDDDVYGPSDAPAEFMMPLTPFLMMVAARNGPDTTGEVQFTVLDERAVRCSHYEQSARRFGSPFVYCRPSYRVEAESSVGEFSSGGFWHWKGLEWRFRQHRYRIPHRQQTYICTILQEQLRRHAKSEKNATPGSPTFAEEHRQWCRDKAAEVEDIFARASVPPAEPTPPLTH